MLWVSERGRRAEREGEVAAVAGNWQLAIKRHRQQHDKTGKESKENCKIAAAAAATMPTDSNSSNGGNMPRPPFPPHSLSYCLGELLSISGGTNAYVTLWWLRYKNVT